MICYKDISFCPYGDCKDKDGCPVLLTPKVEEAAKDFGLPLAIIIERPPCYKE